MVKVLVSSCLIGAPVRYNGKDKKVSHPVLERWMLEGRVVAACPEVLGGLGTPRPPAEVIHVQRIRRVVAGTGRDVTSEFEQGAAGVAVLPLRLVPQRVDRRVEGGQPIVRQPVDLRRHLQRCPRVRGRGHRFAAAQPRHSSLFRRGIRSCRCGDKGDRASASTTNYTTGNYTTANYTTANYTR